VFNKKVDKDQELKFVLSEIQQIKSIRNGIRMGNWEAGETWTKKLKEKVAFEEDRLGIKIDVVMDLGGVLAFDKDGNKIDAIYGLGDYPSTVVNMIDFTNSVKEQLKENKEEPIIIEDSEKYWKRIVYLFFKNENKKIFKVSEEEIKEYKEHQKIERRIKNGEKSSIHNSTYAKINISSTEAYVAVRRDNRIYVQSVYEGKPYEKDLYKVPKEDVFVFERPKISCFSGNKKKYLEEFKEYYEMKSWSQLKRLCEGFISDADIRNNLSDPKRGWENLYVEFKKKLYEKEARKVMLLKEEVSLLNKIRPEHITPEQKAELIKKFLKIRSIKRKSNVVSLDLDDKVSLGAFDTESLLYLGWEMETVAKSNYITIPIGGKK